MLSHRTLRLIVALSLFDCCATAAAETSLFTRAGQMQVFRGGHGATLLPNGKVLITSGAMTSAGATTAEIYDPATGTFRLLESTLQTARSLHTVTPLPNGKLLIAGGYSAPPGPTVAAAELFDPATETFTPLAPMNTARGGHTATLLPNGKVLIAGGTTPAGSAETTELFDPELETFTPAASMSERRGFHCATLLADGNVLITGGSSATTTPELFHSASETFAPVRPGPMTTARSSHTATLLADGRVLLVGGFSQEPNTIASVAVTELYNPATQQFTVSSGQPLRSLRRNHRATRLANGHVLITGGVPSFFRTETAELYDPATESFTALFPHTMREMREHHSATLLPDGRVLLVGGFTGYQAAHESDRAGDTAEIFNPEAIGSATPNQAITLHRRSADGGFYLEGKTTARRAVAIETVAQLPPPGATSPLHHFQFFGVAIADETGAFRFELPPAGTATSGFVRLRLPE